MEKTELKKQCPACGEEILTTAKKCKHCSEWLEEKPDKAVQNNNYQAKKKEDDEPLGWGGRIFSTAFIAAIGWALFFFGSWHLVLGEKINIFLQYLSSGNFEQKNFILDSYGFVFRINEGYWGFVRNDRFFDAPFIQWIMLLFALSAIFLAIRILFTGSVESDEN